MIHPAEANYLLDPTEEKILKAIPMWGQLFKEISTLPFDSSKKSRSCIVYPNLVVKHDQLQALQLNAVDLREDDNSKFNKCGVNSEADVVVKLGGILKFDAFFYRKYDPSFDEIRLIFEPDKCSEEQSEARRLVVRVKEKTDAMGIFDRKETRAKILEHQNQALAIICQFGKDLTLCGWWRMKIVTSIKSTQAEEKNVSIIKGRKIVLTTRSE